MLPTPSVPFFRPDIGEAEITEVVDTLRSGWLTTGSRVQRFEREFRHAVGATHSLALNSCTAALHLALDALNLQPGEGVLVPTMTFAATAEVVRYLGAIPILVDCDPITMNMDLAHAEQLVLDVNRQGNKAGHEVTRIVGIMPVHVGGLMMDVAAITSFAERFDLWVVEDAAHAFPAAWRPSPDTPWQPCGRATADVTCFSFYANKTITTGEGGMAVTESPAIADRMRLMALHGLSHDAWERYSTGGSWDYRIVAPGYKYNLTDVAAAIGVHQLARAEALRRRREALALQYLDQLGACEAIELPPVDPNRVHAWHLFPIKLRVDRLPLTRNEFIESLKSLKVACSVHWRPLHLHPYYQERFGYGPSDCPTASALFDRIVSLPLFPTMTEGELDRVIDTVRAVVAGDQVAPRR
jgi:dTDP-4-amino-4,6-dideoxygalactose transaminase